MIHILMCYLTWGIQIFSSNNMFKDPLIKFRLGEIVNGYGGDYRQ